MQLMDLVRAGRIMESLQQEKLEVSVSYKIMRFLKECQDDIAFYDKKARELIDKYSQKDEKGNPMYASNGGLLIDMDKKEEMDKEVSELNNTEVECPDIKFYIEEFNGIRLSAINLMALDNFIIKEE